MSLDELFGEISEGRVDSSGQFTADPDKARDKLARRQLRPGMWLLKLVQGAIALGADSVEVSSGGLEFSTSHSLEPLHEMLQNPTLAGSPGLRDLAVGILGAEVSVCPHQEGTLVKLQFKKHGLFSRAPRLELGWRCGLAPVPVRLNGKPVPPGDFESAAQVETHLQGLRLNLKPLTPGDDPPRLAVAYRPGTGFRPPRYRAQWHGAKRGTLSQSGCDATWLQGVHAPQVQALLVLPRRPAGLGLLQPVRHGVCLDPERLDLGIPGARAYVDASSLPTDLSDFRLVQNEELRQEVRGWVKDLCRQMHDDLKGDTFLRKYVLPYFNP